MNYRKLKSTLGCERLDCGHLLCGTIPCFLVGGFEFSGEHTASIFIDVRLRQYSSLKSQRLSVRLPIALGIKYGDSMFFRNVGNLKLYIEAAHRGLEFGSFVNILLLPSNNYTTMLKYCLYADTGM
jgi:hypothetical protein